MITLKEILSPQQCAECRGCCHFSESELWECPACIETPSIRSLYGKKGFYVCVHLNDCGCTLGDVRPLECKLYPFRIMRLSERDIAVTLARFCEPVCTLPLSQIMSFVESKADAFAEIAREHPEIIRDYNGEYVVLTVI